MRDSNQYLQNCLFFFNIQDFILPTLISMVEKKNQTYFEHKPKISGSWYQSSFIRGLCLILQKSWNDKHYRNRDPESKYIKSETIQQILWKKWKNYIVHKYDIR